MKVLVVDDELNSRELMQNMLRKYSPEITTIELSDSAESALFMINKMNPDLIFLDIEMPDMNGFALLDSLDSDDFLICFATGYEKYAIKAINYGAFGYILKPIDLEDLRKVIIRASKQLSQKEPKTIESLIVNDGNTIWAIPINEIIHIEADDNHTFIYKANERIMSNFSLNQLEEILPLELIFRTHRSHMVNLSKIKNVKEGRSGKATLESGKEIPVASRRIKDFIDAFLKVKS